MPRLGRGARSNGEILLGEGVQKNERVERVRSMFEDFVYLVVAAGGSGTVVEHVGQPTGPESVKVAVH